MSVANGMDKPMQKPPLKFVERPAYELPSLLKDFNAKTSHGDEMTEALRWQAEGIEAHAINASDTISSGMEAVGAALFSVGTNENWPFDARHLAELGSLIRYLAVEQQYLRDVERDMRDRIETHDIKAAVAAATSGGRK